VRAVRLDGTPDVLLVCVVSYFIYEVFSCQVHVKNTSPLEAMNASARVAHQQGSARAQSISGIDASHAEKAAGTTINTAHAGATRDVDGAVLARRAAQRYACQQGEFPAGPGFDEDSNLVAYHRLAQRLCEMLARQALDAVPRAAGVNRQRDR